MNRAERRKLEKQGYSKASIMKQYKLSFGKKRLQRIMRQIFYNIDGFRTGHLTSGDFQTIKNEMRSKYGVNLL